MNCSIAFPWLAFGSVIDSTTRSMSSSDNFRKEGASHLQGGQPANQKLIIMGLPLKSESCTSLLVWKSFSVKLGAGYGSTLYCSCVLGAQPNRKITKSDIIA